MIVTDADLQAGLRADDPVLCNALKRKGYDVIRLAGLTTGYTGQGSWHDLHDIRNIGPARLLRLVNFFRRQGEELPWFADFDQFTAGWTALRGRERVPPPPDLSAGPPRQRQPAVVSIDPPPGHVELGKLIEMFLTVRNEAGVNDHTLVRVEPEFGRTDEPLFVSNVNVTYPAGSGWAKLQPWIAIEYRRQGLGGPVA